MGYKENNKKNNSENRSHHQKNGRRAKNKKQIKSILFGGVFLLAIGVGCLLGVGAESASAEPVTPALYNLAASCEMHVAGITGEEVPFDADCFARAMNLSSVDAIEITKLPSSAEGKLFVGSVPVSAGQVLTGQNIARLTYAQTGTGESRGSFSVAVNGAAYSITCTVHMLKSVNYSPTVAAVPAVSLTLQTYSGIDAYGVMRAYDPEEDTLLFEIAEYPTHGRLEITDKHTGAYIYHPAQGYTGNDSFRYVASDGYGNYSAGATVSIRVEERSGWAVFSDMESDPAHAAAIRMTGAGIMSGMQVGNGYYFYPDRNMTRADFLVTAMKAVGIQSADVTATGYYDDAEIPSAMKGYVAVAYQKGIFTGFEQDGHLCFCPNEEISRSEAAVVLSNLIGYARLRLQQTFSDSDLVPAWASDAFDSLHSLGILDSRDGSLAPTARLTRGDAAVLLAKTKQVISQ